MRFLSELGKVGPYSLSKAKVVRRWQALDASKENGDLLRTTRVGAAAERGDEFGWSSVSARVSGELPLAEVPTFTVWKDAGSQSVLRTRLDVTAAGTLLLKFDDAAGLSLYVGAKPVDVTAATTIEVPAGVRTLTLVIDRAKRTEAVRVEVEDGTGKAMLYGGK